MAAGDDQTQRDDDNPRIVYGVGYHKQGQGSGRHGSHRHGSRGHGSHGGHYRSDPAANRRQRHSHAGHHHRRTRQQQRHTAVVVLSVIIALVVLVGGCAFALFRSAMGVSRDAQSVMSDVTTMETALATGDSTTAQSTATTMAATAQGMHKETGNVLWKVSSHLPVIGQDLYNVRALARAVDEVCASVVTPLAEQAGSVDYAKIISNGSLDVAAIQTLAETLSATAPQLQETTNMIDDYTTEGSIAAVNNALSQAKQTIDQVNEVVQAVIQIGPHATTILGGEGQTRHYIVVAMGNSEIRGAGGFAADYGLLTITDGRIEMGELSRLQDMSFNGVVTDPDELNFLGSAREQMAPDGMTGDATFNPNFPRTCDFIIANWNKVNHPDYAIDGVIAADPQFVQNMLAVTGGFTTSDGDTVDGTNAAKYMLSDVYWKWNSNAEQDRVFSEIADKAFDKVIHGVSAINILQLGTAVETSIRSRDLNVWFADDDAQLTLVGMGLANIIDDGTTGGSLLNPLLGLYFYNLSYSKIDWYLNAQTHIGEAIQNSDGTKTYTVTTTLKNELTQEQAEQAVQSAEYIIGSRYANTPQAGTMLTLVDFVAPAGGKIEVQSSTFDLEETTYMNRDVWRNTAEIAPQETETVTYTVTVPAEAVSDLTLDMTPTCQEAAGWQ